MFSRPMLFLGVLAAAVVVPYVLFNKNLSSTASSHWNQLIGRGDQDATDDNAWQLTSTSAVAPVNIPTGPEPVPLEQVFRFDFSPRTVTDLWPRVSTVLGETNQMGLRVALITGTRPDDVAGSLTYYFDDHHQVQRITLQGTTGDERRLVHILATQFGLRPTTTLGAGLYTLKGPDGKESKLQAVHMPVVRSTNAHNRVEVAVDLYRSVIVPAEAAAAAAKKEADRKADGGSSWYKLNRPLKSW